MNVNSLSFSFYAPVVAFAWPLRAPCVGDVVLSIVGTNFGVSGVVVTVGGIVCSPLVPPSFNMTFVACTVPPGSGRLLPVVVTANSQVRWCTVV